MLYGTVAAESAFIKLARTIHPEVILPGDEIADAAARKAKNVTNSGIKLLGDAEYEEKLRKEAPSWFSRTWDKIKGFDRKAFAEKMRGDRVLFSTLFTSEPFWTRNVRRNMYSGGALGALVGGLTNDGNRAAGAAGGGALGALVGYMAVQTPFSKLLFKASPNAALLNTVLSVAGQAGAGAAGGKLGAMLDKATGNHLADLTGKAEKSLGLT